MKFGLLGCGMIADLYVSAIACMDESAIAGVYDPDRTRRHHVAVQTNAREYESIEALCKDDAIDVVCVLTPSGYHAEHALAVIRSGKHVVIEKPMCLNLGEADRLMEAAAKSNVRTAVISQLRYSGDVQYAKRAIENHALGKIVSVDLSMLYYRSAAYYQSSAWRGTWAYDGGGALMNQGIHGVDIMQYLLGGVSQVNAFAATQTHPIEVEDSLTAIMKFHNGALGTLHASTACKPGYPRSLTVCGDSGSFILVENTIKQWDVSTQNFDKPTMGRSIENSSANPKNITSNLHKRQLEDFIQSIKSKSRYAVDITEGRKSISIISAIYQAARDGRTVHVH